MSQWDDDGDRLAWAVRKSGKSGAQGWRLFPTVDDEECALSDRLLDVLGVQSLDELSVSQAEYRLQKLQSVFASDLQSNAPSSINIPPERRQDWARAYSQLLQPLMQYISRKDISEVATLQEELSFLTHVPLQRINEEDTEWVAAPLEWLAANASEQVRRYPEESPTPWEQDKVRKNEWYLLAFPQIQTGFADFASALGVQRVDARKPVPSADELTFAVPRRQGWDRSSDRQRLQRRQTILLASIGTTSDERIVEEAEKLEQAIDNIAIVESLPRRAVEKLSAPSSGLYETKDGEIGLVYNMAEIDDIELDALAMGMALLFEQYRNVAIFETALDPDATRTHLRERWRKETFPIQAVEAAIEDHTRRNVRKKLAAGRTLLQPTGQREVPTAGEVIEEFDAADVDEEPTHILHLLSDTIHKSGELPSDVPQKLRTYVDACRNSQSWVRAMLVAFFDEANSDTSWRDLISTEVPDSRQGTAIDWLVEHESLFAKQLTSDDLMRTIDRFLSVYRTWAKTSDPATRLPTSSDWQAAVYSHQHEIEPQLSDTLPPKLWQVANYDGGVRWFVLKDVSQLVTQVIEPFWGHLRAETELSEDVFQTLKRYVETGEFGIETDRGSGNHKNRAYAVAEETIVAGQLNRPDAMDTLRSGAGDNSVEQPTIRARPGSGRGVGGSTQLRGRGEQAEVAVTLDVLQWLQTWLSEDYEGRYDRFVEMIRGLIRDQNRNETEYQWHTKTQWSDTLEPLLDQSSAGARPQFIEYEQLLRDGVRLDALTPVQLLDVSGENGPGFDLIDPFGPIQPRPERPEDWSLDPTPVEIKAVSNDEPPFEFRYTTNEFKQARRFAESSQCYTLRFVYVPDPDAVDWLSQTRIVEEHLLNDTSDLDAMVGDSRFEDIIKGGYLNVTAGEDR